MTVKVENMQQSTKILVGSNLQQRYITQ